MMEYLGYVGQVQFDDDAQIFHGEVLGTRDVITFQGKSVDELQVAFRESIDDYLAFCKDRGEEPNKPFSGQFVTRVSPELHRQISLNAALSGQSLNTWVVEQLQQAVKRTVSKKPSNSSTHRSSNKRKLKPTRKS